MTLHRTSRIGGSDVTYSGSVVEIEVSDGHDGPGARYVCTEYLRTDLSDACRRERPVLFVFNGGPGSSSVWTHLGFGPRRVAAADSLQPPMTPPFRLEDTPHTPLDVTDLVFIDPPGTGYSRLHPETDKSKFYGVEQDARATLQFISQWVRRHERESSPRFIAGESYGAIRAARMAKLANGGPFLSGLTRPTSLNGAIVLGPAFTSGEAQWSGDVQAALELPTIARSARYHGIPRTLGDDEIQRFARTTLLPALAEGNRLEPQDQESIVAQLSDLTGIDAATLRTQQLRLQPDAFTRMLRIEQGEYLGMYDSRYTLPAANAGTDPVSDDPAMGRYAPQFSGVIEQYMRDELGYATDEEYRAIDFRLSLEDWDYDGHRSPSNPPFHDFAEALRRDPRFELMIGVGDYDLVTTLEATSYALSRFSYDMERVHLRRYPSGHMPYMGEDAAPLLAADVREFIARVSARPNGY